MAGRAYATSEDGFSIGRPGEVEMQDLHSGGGGGMQRRPSLPELNSYAGERGGANDFPAVTTLLHCRSCPETSICGSQMPILGRVMQGVMLVT